jgi:DNA-binding winged helix-turn-helix (wHTH) protein
MTTVGWSAADFWVGDWLVRPSLARIERGTETVHVTPRSMAVLVYLAAAEGRVVPRNQILDAIWPRMAVTQDALSQCIVELRKAFHDDAKGASVIETIPKLGIRLIGPVSDAPPAARPSAGGSDHTLPANPSDGLAQPRDWLAQAARIGRFPRWAVAALIAIVLGIAVWASNQDFGLLRQDPLAGADFSPVTDFIGAE